MWCNAAGGELLEEWRDLGVIYGLFSHFCGLGIFCPVSWRIGIFPLAVACNRFFAGFLVGMTLFMLFTGYFVFIFWVGNVLPARAKARGILVCLPLLSVHVHQFSYIE